MDKAREQGRVVLLEIDVQGGLKVKSLYPDALMIFILPPNDAELATRLNGRARDTAESRQKRLSIANSEIAAAAGHYDYKVVNDELASAVNEVTRIINEQICGVKND